MVRKGREPFTRGDLTRGLNSLERRLREELTRFATKEDLKAFATKEDLKAFATKEDLERFAAKEDLQALRVDLRGDIKRVAVQVARLEGEVHEIQHFLAAQVLTKRDIQPTMQLVDKCLKGFEEERELRHTQRELLNRLMDRLDDHERRITRLES